MTLANSRHLWFAAVGALLLALFWTPLSTVARLALRDERYYYVLIIPVITPCLIYAGRKQIFQVSRYCPSLGIPLFLVGFAAYWGLRKYVSLSPDGGLSLVALSIIAVWLSLFLLFYGTRSFQAALFPLCFLVLMVPMPAVAVARIVVALQQASAETANVLFRLVGVPFFREDLKFLLPGVQIEVAEECSGIRSSSTLLIASIVVGYIVLQSGWRRLILSLVTIPIVIFKNAVRIVTISWLGVYVNHDFLYGKLHRNGGLPFSLLAFAILLPLLVLLNRSESRREATADDSAPALDSKRQETRGSKW
jgi:exosortase